jgi:uncharacterized protein (TIGR02231 family)
MKLIGKLLISSVYFVATYSATAQTKQKASIDHISVFLIGAAIESSAKINLPQGESEVLFTNIAGNLIQQSLSVGANNGVIVLSATPKNDYLSNKNLSPKAQILKDSVELLQHINQTLSDKKTVLDEQLALLKENRKISGINTGLSVMELQKMIDLIGNKMNTLLTDSRGYTNQINKNNERISLLSQQLNEEQSKDFQPGGQLLVKFYCAQTINSNVHISYVTPNASWSPIYDIRVDKINAPVKLIFKANIVQNTGVKWDNVPIVLSTGNPNEGAEAPQMSPWYLSFNMPQTYAYKNNASMAPTGAARSIGDDDIRPFRENNFTQSSLDDYVQVDNSGINTTYDINLNYTIPSDGQAHLVAVKEYELPAQYRYCVSPKLDKDVFLQARITNWEELNLMPASSSIYYEGTYVGQGFIDMRNVKDTLNLSLGRDKKIIVLRENDKNYRSSKTIGSNIRRSFGYTIEIRNTKKEQIELAVLEQFPISNDKDIVIEDQEALGATINETTGAIQWEIALKGNELKTLKLNYSVKYPKDKNINGL